MSDYTNYYNSAAQQYGEDPRWLQAMSQQESQGNPNAVSPKGATGVMQLMPGTAQDLGVTDSTDPAQNIAGGAKYYAENKKKYADPNLALMAYNWGPGNVDKWIQNGANPEEVPQETRDYVRKVNQNYRQSQGNTMQSSQEMDPLEARAAGQDLSNSPGANDNEMDPLEARAAGKDLPPQPAQVAQSAPPSGKLREDQPGYLSDIGQSIAPAIVRGIGAIPQVLTYGTNQMIRAIPYAYEKGYPLFTGKELTPQQKQILDNPKQLYTGTTLADTLTKTAAGLIGQYDKNLTPQQKQNLAGVEQNGIVDNDLYEPKTIPGQLVSAGVMGAVGAPSEGMAPALGAAGGIAAQGAQTLFPHNPLAPLLAGAGVAGTAALGKKVLSLNSSPEDIANNIIKENVGGKNGVSPRAINTNEIIPGSKPTLAEATENPNVAVLERQMQMQNPAAFAENELIRENARKNYFEQASGTPQDIDTLKTQRKTVTEPLYEVAGKQPLDTRAISPILDKIDAAIEQVGSGSDAGKTLATIRSKITGAMPSTKMVNSKVLDSEGNPIQVPGKTTNPTQSPLIQIYREERDALQKPATAQGAYAGTVKSVIQPIVSDLGDALESQSPEFAKAQQAYRTISPQIDAAQWLQGLKLTDATGKFTLAKVNNALQNAQKMRSANGVNSAKSLTNAQMSTLQSLRDDLLRRENVQRASMPRNSATIQNNIATNAINGGLVNKLTSGNIPAFLGTGAGNIVGSFFGSPTMGGLLGELGGAALKGIKSRKSAAAKETLQNFLMNPEDYKQHLLTQGANATNNWQQLVGTLANTGLVGAQNQ